MREFNPHGRRRGAAPGFVTIEGDRMVMPESPRARLWMFSEAALWAAQKFKRRPGTHPQKFKMPRAIRRGLARW